MKLEVHYFGSCFHDLTNYSHIALTGSEGQIVINCNIHVIVMTLDFFLPFAGAFQYNNAYTCSFQ